MAPVLSVGAAFFPLDEQLGLLSSAVSPRAEETLVRLSSWMSFEAAQEFLVDLVGVRVSKATARRATLMTGQAEVVVSEREEQRLTQQVPEPPVGAECQSLSADGAMVHLVGGEWVEVKTLALGEVTRNQRGEGTTQQLSYFSRLLEASRFEEAALVETHRRGLERAKAVCAVQDGAQWLQGLVDYHRADAVRILDFAHAAEYVAAIGEAVREAGGHLPGCWLEGVLHRLKHQGPQRVLEHLAWLAVHYPGPLIQEKLAYLQKREAQMQYPTYQEEGWPIGSGSVESANKLVVEARLKGAGMRWRRQNVNPMLLLRNAVCNRRWQENWQAAVQERQAQRRRRRQGRSEERLTRACWTMAAVAVRLARLTPPSIEPIPPTPPSPPSLPLLRPAAAYSWRQPFLRRPPSASASPGAVSANK